MCPERGGPTTLSQQRHRGSLQIPFPLSFVLFIGLFAPSAFAEVLISETDAAGRDVFRIETPSASYVYDKKAAALIEIYDRDGNDWISFRPEGTPGIDNGADGWFRGLPQLGSPDFGHTRRVGAVSSTPDPLGVPLSQATIEATAEGWHLTWEFFPSHAKMTLHQAPDNYWLLYEGTPGGVLNLEDTCWRADGQGMSCDRSWSGDIVNTSGAAKSAEWVYFADSDLERSFFLAHEDDDIVDSYFRKGGMTVFGFGRERNTPIRRLTNIMTNGKAQDPKLKRTPEVLVIGFVEARDFETVKREIDRLYQIEPLTEDPSPHAVPVATEDQEPPA